MLGGQSRVLVLSAIAPYRCLLFAQQSYIAGCLGLSKGAVGDGASEVRVGRGSVRNGRLYARVAKCADGRRSPVVELLIRHLVRRKHRRGVLRLRWEDVGRRCSRARVAVDASLVHFPARQAKAQSALTRPLRSLVDAWRWPSGERKVEGLGLQYPRSVGEMPAVGVPAARLPSETDFSGRQGPVKKENKKEY